MALQSNTALHLVIYFLTKSSPILRMTMTMILKDAPLRHATQTAMQAEVYSLHNPMNMA